MDFLQVLRNWTKGNFFLILSGHVPSFHLAADVCLDFSFPLLLLISFFL